MKKRVAVIGGGIAGLAVGLLLNKKKYEVSILEKESEPGGHCRSMTADGFTFDWVGAHILFSKNQAVMQFIKDVLYPNIYQAKRNNQISYKNCLVKYPYENDLASLPPQDKFEALNGYLFNKNKYAKPKNLKEWLLDTFGKGICEQYLFPYNEKVWNLPVEDLSMIWADRIPKPPVEDVIKSALGWQTEGYTHQLYFYYPKYGGIDAYTKAFAQLVRPHISTNVEVQQVYQDGKEWVVIDQNRQERRYDLIINTSPIQAFVKKTKLKYSAKELKAVKDLVQNPLITVMIGVKKPDPNRFTAIYFPEKEFLVNRLAYNGVFSPYNDPAGQHGMVAEITCKATDKAWKMSDEELIEHVVGNLEKRQLLERDNIVHTSVRRMPYAYVVYDKNYQKNQPIAVKAFTKNKGLYMFGRFAEHLYHNTDAIIERALELAVKINGQPTKFPSLADIKKLRAETSPGVEWPGLPTGFVEPSNHPLDRNLFVGPPSRPLADYKKLGKIAITMPVYNEEEIIEKVIREFHEVARQLPNAVVLASEDGSTDRTKEILTRLEQELPHFKASMSPNRAGAAQGQRNALAAAAKIADTVVITDSDGQHVAEDVYSLLNALLEGADYATGRKINRDDPPARLYGSKVWNWYIRVMFKLNTQDVNSGFKAMSKKMVNKILPQNTDFSECVLTEFTARVKAANYVIKEIPVRHRARLGEARAWNQKKMATIAWGLLKSSWLLRKKLYS